MLALIQNSIVIAAVVRGWDESESESDGDGRSLSAIGGRIEWAHEARDVSVRQHYAKLCQIWLECATRAELRSGVITPPEPTVKKVA